MIPFERQFQTFHSVQNYLLLNELLAAGFPMPLVDTDALRKARAAFVEQLLPSVPTTSPGRPPRRCCSTWSTRCCEGGTMQAFGYERPQTLDQAVALLDRYGPDGPAAGRRHRPDHRRARAGAAPTVCSST